MTHNRLAVTVLAASLTATSLATIAPAQVVDLSQLGATHPGFRIEGIGAIDFSGRSVSGAGAGDVNGDGLADLIIGSPDADPNGYSSGESYVVFGKTGGDPVSLATLEADNAGFRIDGIEAYDQSGFSVSGAGDVNGDGLADLIIGAPDADPNGNSLAGESYVVFGKSTSTPVSLASLGSGGFRIDGIDAFDNSGRSVSGAGDVNGDGLADLIVGAWFAQPNGENLAGESYVVFGKSSSAAVDLANLGSGGFRIDGIDADDRSGFSVSGAGDVNGDGLADLIVGAYRADPNGDSGAGESYVVFGKSSSAAVDLASLGSGGFRIDGIDAYDYSGFSVSGAGDVNGDGLADLIIGAFSADPNGDSYAGESYVVFGKSTSAAVDLANLGSGGFRIDGIDANDQSGFSASGAGDVNGDGLADLIIGAPDANPNGESAAGESYVVFGKADSTAVDLANLGTGGFRIDGIDANDQSGFSVSGAGDVNGDGLADLIVGARYAVPNGETNVGEFYVVFGPGPGVTASSSAIYNVQLPAGELNEVAVGITGDGSDVDNPSSQAFVDFNGAGATAGTLEVELIRNQTALPPSFVDGNTADVYWRITTTRTGWTSADVTLKYTDAQISGLNEANLIVYQNDDLTGAWTEITPTIDQVRNELSFNVTGFSYFALGDVSGLPVELDAFRVE